jgi:calcium-dependent protein kinase
MLRSIDKNGNGEIDFSEFIQAVYDYSELLSSERIKNAFDFFDTNKDGSITRDELRQVFASNQTCSRESKQFDNTWR